MNGCIYRTEDNKCEFYSDHGKGIVSYCDFDDCEEKKQSNYDRLRAKSVEEMAEFLGAIIHDYGQGTAEIEGAGYVITD